MYEFCNHQEDYHHALFFLFYSSIKARNKEREELYAKNTATHPIPRAGTAEEVARGILFMIQNDFVTGTTIDVDGGWLLA